MTRKLFNIKPITKLPRWCWKLIHRFHPKHQYHVLKPRSLEPGYHDPCERIFHAAFDDLSVFAETYLMGEGHDQTRWTHEDYEYYEKEARFELEGFRNQVEREKQIIELRNWWVIDRPNRQKVEDALYELMAEAKPEGAPYAWTIDSTYDDTPEKKNYRKHCDKLWELEEQWAQEDTKKFHELVELLPYLWY